MTNPEAYLEGFCKTAESVGVDPAVLCKKAGISETLFGSGKFPFDPGVLQKLMANEHLRRALATAAVSGATAAIVSPENRLRNALLAAGIGGAASYGASATGVMDNMPKYFNNVVREVKARDLTWKYHGSPRQRVSPEDAIRFLRDFSQRHPLLRDFSQRHPHTANA